MSVIIPTYQRAELLMERAIPSVIKQTYPWWECHVVGDGTDEATVAAMADLCERNCRFRFTNLPHQEYPGEHRWDHWGLLGLNALNYGLDTAAGDWVAVLGDDDEFTADHHEVLIAAAIERDVDFAYGVSTTNWGQRYGAWPPGDGQLTNGSYVYRGAARDYRYALDCTERGRTGDADMWLRMYEGGVKFAFIEKVVHMYFPSQSRGWT